MIKIGRFVGACLLLIYGLGSLINGLLQIFVHTKFGTGIINVIVALVCFSFGMRLMRQVAAEDETNVQQTTTTTSSISEVRRSDQTAS